MQLEKILHYRLSEHLGSGAFGDVYKGYDERLNRHVAIKIASPSDDQAMEEEMAARFKREVGATVKLNHPNIVTVFDTGTIDSKLYYVMAFLPGGDLKKNNNRLKSNLAILDVCMGVAKALAYAHDEGFIHRDIKPENILFDEHNNAIVADFGIVKMMAEDHTQGRYVLGTPSYSAPEQMNANEDIDGRADLYSLGKVLHLMLTKQKYSGDGSDTLPSERMIFQPVLNKLLSTDKNQRFRTAHELIDALSEIQLELKQSDTIKTQLKPTLATKPKKNKLVLPGVIAAVVCVAAVAGGLVLGGGSSNSEDDSTPVEVADNSGASTNSSAQNTTGSHNTGGQPPNLPPGVSPSVTPENITPEPTFDAIVSITSTPDGADVFLNGDKVGTTPFTSEAMPTGNQVFQLKKRFHNTRSVPMVLVANQVSKQSVELEVGTGVVSVLSEPAGAQVLINGKKIAGTTPLSINDVTAGTQTIEIQKGDVSVATEVDVEANQVTKVETALASNLAERKVTVIPEQGIGTLSLNTNPPGATVYIDGTEEGTTPLLIEDYPAGNYIIKLAHKFFAENQFEAQVKPNAAFEQFVELEPGYGSVSVITNPVGATVAIDGEDMKGTTPLSLNNIAAGVRSVDIRKGDLRLRKTIEVVNGKAVTIDETLEQGSLISFNNDYKTTEEWLEIAEASKDKSKSIDIYYAILDAKSEHREATEALEKLKDGYIALARRQMQANNYTSALQTASFVSQKFGDFYDLPDLVGEINTHQVNHEQEQLAAQFANTDAAIRNLLKRKHFAEAAQLIKGLPSSFKPLAGYSSLMGDYQSETSRYESTVLALTGPLALVKVSGDKYLRAFAHEATFAQWDACYDDGFCARRPNDFGWGRSNRPVIDVSYKEIQEQFIPWINKKTGLEFKLPNETQWSTLYGNTALVSHVHANGPSGFGWGNDGSANTAPVGSYEKNANGIYDINGNVWEWVDECAESSCARRLLKGGSWNSAPMFFTKKESRPEFPERRANDIGFRLVEDYTWQL